MRGESARPVRMRSALASAAFASFSAVCMTEDEHIELADKKELTDQ